MEQVSEMLFPSFVLAFCVFPLVAFVLRFDKRMCSLRVCMNSVPTRRCVVTVVGPKTNARCALCLASNSTCAYCLLASM
jgi:hypothetical protein